MKAEVLRLLEPYVHAGCSCGHFGRWDTRREHRPNCRTARRLEEVWGQLEPLLQFDTLDSGKR